MPIEQLHQVFSSLSRNIGICLIMALATSSCSTSTPQINSTNPLPLIAIPTATFISSSNETPTNTNRNRSSIYSIVAILRNSNQTIQTIEFDPNRTYAVDMRLAGLVLINYSKEQHTFIAISFPQNLSVGTYPIGQVLRTAPAYAVENLSQVGVAYRYFTEIPPFGEPETSGDACEFGLSGQFMIRSRQPLQGEYQFVCQFPDGSRASVAGKFSQY